MIKSMVESRNEIKIILRFDNTYKLGFDIGLL